MNKLRTASASLILLISIIICSSFKKTDPDKFLKKNGFSYILNSTEVSAENKTGFYISKTEVSNQEYLDFLNDLKEQGRTADYEIAKVDTAAWKNAMDYSTVYESYYFQHEMYANYPVLNISFEGAKLYCEWLTQQIKKEGYNVLIRLPDSIEWKTAARGGNNQNIYSWEGNSNVNKKGFYKCNSKKGVECDYITAPVLSFKKNEFGIYNACGNVAEMLNEKGTHKGGSWNSAENYIKLDSKDEYAGISTPSPYIGFRPVAIIME